MRAANRDRLTGLTLLHRLGAAEEQDAAWRQSIATLARAVVDERQPVPLEGLDPDALLQSMQVAVDRGLVDRLDWLSPPAAAAALYEVAAALPASPVKRLLGRMVLQRLRLGDAPTFVSLATQLALGSQRALSGRSMRARVALALNLPIGSVANVDALALALISRQDLSREWLKEPAIGSLPSRRLAARLLERAAREAARRATEGDDSGIRVFCAQSVRESWDRLLADRESLVWRHVASARGLLAASMPVFRDEISRHLDPDFSVTEWRRAAASLAASIAVESREGLLACRALLQSVTFEQDHGIAAAMIVGLVRAAESHPDVAETLLEQLARVGGLETAEALVALRRERVQSDFGKEAAKRTEAHLRKAVAQSPMEDPGRVALMEALAGELSEVQEASTLRDMLSDALEAFASEGTREAARTARPILEAAAEKVSMLEEQQTEHPEDESTAFLALRELDEALFESDSLNSLLVLGNDDDHEVKVDHELGDLFQRITNWLVIREGDPLSAEGGSSRFTTRLRQLRTMLHLVDADGPHVDDRRELVRQRRLLTQQVLLSRVCRDTSDPLRRALCAATARTCDALVREDIADVSDIIVAAAWYVPHLEGLETMAEASMIPEIEQALAAYGKLHRVTHAGKQQGRALRSSIEALRAVGNELPVARSARIEALRQAILRLARALRNVAIAGSLAEVAERSAGSPLEDLEQAIDTLGQLIQGARRRLGSALGSEHSRVGETIRALGLEVERALRTSISEIDRAYAAAVRAVEQDLPGAFAEVTKNVLKHLRSIPLDGPRRAVSSIPVAGNADAPLPAWAPPSRVVGGFYLIRSVATGAVGSVFIARRVEERDDEDAPPFALKVPDYSAAAARTLSEEEFLRLFRQEAGALLALPEHPNIARFVTFDAGARPKPILVMELVQGPSLERMLEMGDLSLKRATDLLLGVGSGLDAMHQVGIGHLDVKPSNIIVRNPDGSTAVGAPSRPVLVDFGLAGRQIRPGCGTANYGAPEIWGLGDATQSIPADVYAFGCLIFETYTGRTLFDGVGEAGMISQHISHDGDPDPIRALREKEGTEALANLVSRCIRRDPADRITIRQARQFLAGLRRRLEGNGWPLSVD